MEQQNLTKLIRTSIAGLAAFFSFYQFADKQTKLVQQEKKKKEYLNTETISVSNIENAELKYDQIKNLFKYKQYFVSGIPKPQLMPISVYSQEAKKNKKEFLYKVSQEKSIYSNDSFEYTKFNPDLDYKVVEKLEPFSLVNSIYSQNIQKLQNELKRNFFKIKQNHSLVKMLELLEIQNQQVQIDSVSQTNPQYATVFLGKKLQVDTNKLNFPSKLQHYFSYLFSGLFGNWAFKGAQIAYGDYKFGVKATGMLSVLGSVIYDTYKKHYIVENPILLTLSKEHLLYETTNQINKLLKQRDFWALCCLGFGIWLWKEQKLKISQQISKYWNIVKKFILKTFEQFRQTPITNQMESYIDQNSKTNEYFEKEKILNIGSQISNDPDALKAFQKQFSNLEESSRIFEEEEKTKN